MRTINFFIDHTVKWFLIVFGLITCGTLPMALNIETITPLFGGMVDFTASSVPALRHWAFVIFCVGVLMIAASFRPWLRFETMLLSGAEKGFIVYLFVTNLDEPWIMGYFPAVIVDGLFFLYSIVFFVSERGRP
ncbi:hypothetical protein ACWGNA_27330 [Brucella cytisi]|jgi:hypothetical protein|uniref:hypothetical protein n=1 Tax=Brucella cytisi TaxID=407152 RepID=UPI0035DA6848